MFLSTMHLGAAANFFDIVVDFEIQMTYIKRLSQMETFLLHVGKIISIDTSSLRAAGRTGWEDLVRKCIYAFFQPQGREPSYARQLFQEGKIFFS